MALSTLMPLAGVEQPQTDTSEFKGCFVFCYTYEEAKKAAWEFCQEHPGVFVMALQFRKHLYRNKTSYPNHPYMGWGFALPNKRVQTFAAPVDVPTPQCTFAAEVMFLQHHDETVIGKYPWGRKWAIT